MDWLSILFGGIVFALLIPFVAGAIQGFKEAYDEKKRGKK